MTGIEGMTGFILEGLTDTGLVRKANEDSIGSGKTVNGLAVIVCDGMGGHRGGATASSLAVSAILHYLDKNYRNSPADALVEAIDYANKIVISEADKNPALSGMGSTCVVALLRDNLVWTACVGDSRIYLIRDGSPVRLTKDQSYVQTLVDQGLCTEEEADRHPRANEITNAVGLRGMTPAVTSSEGIKPLSGDCFLLCSDGLSKMVSDSDIARICSAQKNFSAAERCSMLIDAAKRGGGKDNISAQILEFPAGVSDGKLPLLSRGKLAAIAATAVTVILIGGTFLLHPWKRADRSSSDDTDTVVVINGARVIKEKTQEDKPLKDSSAYIKPIEKSKGKAEDDKTLKKEKGTEPAIKAKQENADAPAVKESPKTEAGTGDKTQADSKETVQNEKSQEVPQDESGIEKPQPSNEPDATKQESKEGKKNEGGFTRKDWLNRNDSYTLKKRSERSYDKSCIGNLEEVSKKFQIDSKDGNLVFKKKAGEEYYTTITIVIDHYISRFDGRKPLEHPIHIVVHPNTVEA